MTRKIVFMIALALLLAACTAFAAGGGPNTYGYSWIDDVPYNWIDTSAGTPVTLGDDESVGPIAIGFTFNFYGTNQTELYIGSNGLIVFGGEVGFSTWINPCPLSSSGEARDTIALHWDDLSPNNGGTVRYLAEADRFIVEYNQVPHFGSTDVVTAQVILNKDGTIVMQYQQVDWGGSSASVGLVNVAADDQLLVDCNNTFLSPGYAIAFFTGALGIDIGWAASTAGNIPGHDAIHIIWVRNNTWLDATIDFAYSLNSWALDCPATFDVPRGEIDYFKCYVTVPADATPGDTDPLQVDASIGTYSDSTSMTSAAGETKIVDVIDLGTYANDTQILGIEFVEPDRLYATGGARGFDPNMVYEYDLDGSLLNVFEQTGTTSWGWRDLAWDGTYLYGSASTNMDYFQTDGTYIGNFTGPIDPNRALAYDPDTDHFWTCSFSSDIYEFDETDTIHNQYTNTLGGVYGFAWDNAALDGPWLWTFAQTGSPHGIYQFDPDAGDFTELYIPGYNAADYAGGLDFTTEWPAEDQQDGWVVGYAIAMNQGEGVDYAMVVELWRYCDGCLIDETCWDEGDLNPENECLWCDTAESTSAWSDNDGYDCDDGVFCNGADTCNAAVCEHAGDPCGDDGEYCNGTESCDEDNDECVSSGDPCGDDGEFCNGDESCDEDNDECVSSGDPCGEDETCNEETDTCDEVTDDDDDAADDDAADDDAADDDAADDDAAGDGDDDDDDDGCCGC